MFRGLFARLTGRPGRGQELFDIAVEEARQTHWFLDGGVPDTVSGRFAVLATIVALLTVRLERGGPAGELASVALTERLVEALDTELREMGLGDPTLGKQVRKLVGSVGGRVERWRALVDGEGNWPGEIVRSLDLPSPHEPAALRHCETALRALWQKFTLSGVEELVEGRIQ